MDTIRVSPGSQWPAAVDATLFEKLAELSADITEAIAHGKTRPDPEAVLQLAAVYAQEIAELADWSKVKRELAS